MSEPQPIQTPVPAPAADAVAPPISRAIYGMPMFATVTVIDLDATVSWYVDGLGFIVLFSIPGPDGVPLLVHVRRWQFQDVLVRRVSEPVSAGAVCTLSFAAVFGELDALAARARAHGGGRVDGPADTPWNTRDLTTTGPDGIVVVFTAPRPPELIDETFSTQMRQWNAEQRPDGSPPAAVMRQLQADAGSWQDHRRGRSRAGNRGQAGRHDLP